MKKLNKLFIILGVLSMAIAPNQSFSSEINDNESVETVGIFVRGLKICHQNEWRNLSVNLEYDADIGGGAMDVQAVKQHIRVFLEKYSNSDDFWEVMNTNLVYSLMGTFPDIISMKSTLSLAPDVALNFPRESVVSYERGSVTFKESFNFTKLNYLICQQTFRSLNLHVAWEVKENPSMFDYPDYQWVDQAMEEFFKEHPVSVSEWKSLKPRLEVFLLERFPSLTSINVDVTIVE